jgi:hypothetical protein
MAWNIKTMIPRILVVPMPNSIAERPVPVMWLQLPVTDGIFNEEITKINAPDIERSINARLFSLTVLRKRMKPMTKNGMQTTPQAIL